MHERIQEGALTEVTLFVLLALYHPNHGYGIMQFVKEMTNGRVVLGAGTLYGALTSLEKKGWIEAIKTQTEDRKKQYLITTLGKEMVQKEKKRLQEVITLLQLITKEDMV